MAQKRIRVYWPNCSVCQFMRRHPEFRTQVMESKYFNPEGKETIKDVLKRWDLPVSHSAVYNHLQKHQAKDLVAAEKKFPVKPVDFKQLDVEGAHLEGLDDFIEQGRQKLAAGDLHITAESFLKAIKTKADIEDKNKDRKLDALKMMAGVYKQKDDPGRTTESQ